MGNNSKYSKEIYLKTSELFDEVRDELNDLVDLYEGGIAGINPNAVSHEVEGESDFLSFYQTEGVDLLFKRKRILIADDMGMGKTAQGIAGKLEIENRTGRKCRAYIVCPNDARDLWEERIDQYCIPERRGNILVARDYSTEEVEQLSSADWVILNFEATSHSEDSNIGPACFFKSLMKQIKKDKKNGVVVYLIFDEVHKTKSSSDKCNRSVNTRALSLETDYLCCLSGTPVPSWLRDIYLLISILEPDTFKTPSDVAAAFRKDPRIIRSVFRRCRLRRTQAEIMELPLLTEEVRWVSLSSEQKEVYSNVLNDNSLTGGIKLQYLKKALLDPRIIKPSFLPKGFVSSSDPVKYLELDKVIEEICVKRREKLVVFSPLFRKGIMEELVARYSHVELIRLDGTVKSSHRKILRERFQNDQETKLCLATDVVGEAITLTAATTIVFIDNLYSPGDRDQMIKRVHRPGQMNPVHIITLAVQGTVDEGTIEFLRLKREAIDFLEKGLPMGEFHRNTLISPSKSESHHKYLYTPQQIISKLAGKMAGLGYKKIMSGIKKNDWAVARQYAENYVLGWDGSLSWNVAQACSRVIKGLEKKRGRSFKSIVDVGGAFGVLSHALKRSTIVTDINPKHVETKFYKKHIASYKNEHHLVPFHDLPKDWKGKMDFVCCSLSLHQCDGRDTESERVQSLREIQRILNKDGFALIALPMHTVGSNVKRFMKVVKHIGLTPVSEVSGILESVQSEQIGLKVLFILATKSKIKKKSKVSLHLACDSLSSKKGKEKIYSMKRQGKVREFIIHDRLLSEALSLI